MNYKLKMTMMKKTRISLFILAIVTAGFAFHSCDKVSNDPLSGNQTTVTDYTALLGVSDLTEIDDATSNEALKSTAEKDFMPCFKVTFHKNETGQFWPLSWTFSYTGEDCTDCFGNIKSGSVHVLLTDLWKNEGSSRTMTFEDFSINGNKLEGTRNILNTGFNDQQNLTFEYTCQDASLSRGDTATMSWDSNSNVEMIAGYEYMVSGSASGVNFDGKSFTVNITDALYYKKCGLFPVSGVITIEVDGGSSIEINYGDGDCDHLAEMTVDNVTTEITLGLNTQTCRAEN